MKRLLTFILAISILLIFTLSPKIDRTAFADFEELKISAQSAYVCDANSGTEIFSKNANERRPIASITKIMLLILAFEKESTGHMSFTDEITISKNASAMGGSQVFLQANGIYKVNDLIKSIIVASANDASVAIAEYLFGNEQNTVAIMNDKAKELKLTNTLFSNCTGLTKPTQYSSAKDVAVMLKELLKYDDYYKFSTVYLDELVHPDGQKTTLANTNKLIKFYNGCDGGKTGFTNEAGFCLCATAKRGDMRVISVLINEPDSKTRFNDCSKLFDYSFANYSSKIVLSAMQPSDLNVLVENGKDDRVEIVPEKNYYIFGLKNKKENVKIDLALNEKKVKAPISKGAILGKYSIYKDGILLDQINAVANNSVEKKTYFDVIKDISER